MIIVGSRAFQAKLIPFVAPTVNMDHDFIAYEEEWNEYQARMQGRTIEVKKPECSSFRRR